MGVLFLAFAHLSLLGLVCWLWYCCCLLPNGGCCQYCVGISVSRLHAFFHTLLLFELAELAFCCWYLFDDCVNELQVKAMKSVCVISSMVVL